ncbi:hypothetical protein F5877DRAFT_85640 [Lentinula edodes]|nr:hypothetical protein F5877DRAFT_85640 [Lentinula edodes]
MANIAVQFPSGEPLLLPFYVTHLDSSCKAVLGYSFLSRYNPLIDWASRNITFRNTSHFDSPPTSVPSATNTVDAKVAVPLPELSPSVSLTILETPPGDSLRSRSRTLRAKPLLSKFPFEPGLLEAITLLLYCGLHHTPNCLASVIDFVLGYLSQARFTHGELHLRSTSSLLYYYSNTADRVEGLYQEMLTHSRFPSHDTFLTAAQHAGYVDARPGSLEPPLHRRFFSFDHPIPISSSPSSDHLPTVPAMDSIMVFWERLIANYICNMIDTPGPQYSFPTSMELPDVGSGPSLSTDLVLAGGNDENVSRGMGIAVRRNATTPAEEGNKDCPEGGLETPLFLPGSRSPSSPIPLPSVPVVPDIIDLTMVDDGEDLYESHEEFEARVWGDVAVKSERSSPVL